MIPCDVELETALEVEVVATGAAELVVGDGAAVLFGAGLEEDAADDSGASLFAIVTFVSEMQYK